MSIRIGDTIIAGSPLYRSAQYTIESTDWDEVTQSVDLTFNGVTTASDLLVCPASTSLDNLKAFGEAYIYGSAQSANTVTLTCETIPEVAVTVIIGVLK